MVWTSDFRTYTLAEATVLEVASQDPIPDRPQFRPFAATIHVQKDRIAPSPKSASPTFLTASTAVHQNQILVV